MPLSSLRSRMREASKNYNISLAGLTGLDYGSNYIRSPFKHFNDVIDAGPRTSEYASEVRTRLLTMHMYVPSVPFRKSGPRSSKSFRVPSRLSDIMVAIS